MPTTLPRVNVVFEKPTYEALEKISRAEGASLSQVVSHLVQSALELAEDLSLAETAEERLRTFRRDDALSSDDLLKWNRTRKRRAA